MILRTILVNWKTTAAAVGMLATVVVQVVQALNNESSVDWNTIIPELLCAIALLFARDADVSSARSGAKP